MFLNSSEEREREDETSFNETQSKVDEHGKEGSEHSSNKTVTLLLTPNKTLKALETPFVFLERDWKVVFQSVASGLADVAAARHAHVTV